MKSFINCFILLSTFFLTAQEASISDLKETLKHTANDFEKAKINLKLAHSHERVDLNKGMVFAHKAFHYKANDSLLAETTNQLGRFHFFTGSLDSAYFYFNTSKNILHKLKDDKRAAIINISIGAIQLKQGDYNKTIATLTESASFFEKTNDKLNAAKCYSNIASAFAELELYPKAIEYSEKALGIFESLNQTRFRLITLPNLATQHYKNGDTVKAIAYNTDAEKLATELGDKRSLSIIYNNLGELFLDSNPEKARTYLEKTVQLKDELNLKSGIEVAQNNLGYTYLKNKDYATAINYFKKAEKTLKGKQLVSVYNNLSEAYSKIGRMENAFEYAKKSNTLNDSILNVENQKSFLEIQTKYETEKKENEILKLETENLEVDYKRKQNFYLFIGALLALSLAIVSLYFLQKNAKRKRIIMQQNLKIKEQDFDQLLQEKELEGIDNILEAQEKERSKMAAELHDNLGSKVATLKLFLESYDEKEDFSNHYKKLKTLIGDTYNEIRNISKNKNFGAQISSGLIPSTKAIADQISETKKIKIDVINIDVKKRIENNIEIQIFRIIQELITNIIKHSEATEATIQFSEDDDMLNIIVEDNGKGFDLNRQKSGIGLINIEKRVEKMQGDVVIDTAKGNGTTVILNIPL
ncbi:sensor histidine kinase [Hyunsoonleella sp. SJ7]|uniref:histidine kinase n=1 Tax=Hyunsoonleella aquatilis TaxID=2762758 RepID=A0A923H813_9FLAO|nr:sensor histidine kinase [Hyunsoonleella aquatilis]MBC3756844.1 sensor histidine kinase [Hyunsoonleella aquatilis]